MHLCCRGPHFEDEDPKRVQRSILGVSGSEGAGMEVERELHKVFKAISVIKKFVILLGKKKTEQNTGVKSKVQNGD